MFAQLLWSNLWLRRDRKRMIKMLKPVAIFFPGKIEQSNYLVNISERHKFVYVETPKVACSSIKKALQLIEVDGDTTKIPDDVHDRDRSPLAGPATPGIDLEVVLGSSDYFRFSFVRNPFSRVLATYLDKFVQNEFERARLMPVIEYPSNSGVISFEQFLVAIRRQPDFHKDIHWAPQTYLLAPHRVPYSYIGRFETFGTDWLRVLKRIAPQTYTSFAEVRTDFHKTEAGSKVLTYFGPIERELALDIYQDDFKNFGYSELLEAVEEVSRLSRPVVIHSFPSAREGRDAGIGRDVGVAVQLRGP